MGRIGRATWREKSRIKFLSLRSKAKKVALQLEIKDLKVRGGVIKLKEKLDKAFSKDKIDYL